MALHQPDIAGNTGTIMRLCACMGVPLDIVMPCGFPLSGKDLRRAAMDYGAEAEVVLHPTLAAFLDMVADRRARIVLLTSHGESTLPDIKFAPDDILLLGSEGAGAPAALHERADLRARIPMRSGFRSLNIAVAAGIALGEALRQTGQLPT